MKQQPKLPNLAQHQITGVQAPVRLNTHMISLSEFKQLPSLVGADDLLHINLCLGNRLNRRNTVIDEVEPNELKNLPLWTRENPGLDPNFKYRYNEAGFRSGPINNAAEVGYFGCSVTFGVGVPEEYRWTNLLDKPHGWTSNNWGYVAEPARLFWDYFQRLVSIHLCVKHFSIFPNITEPSCLFITARKIW